MTIRQIIELVDQGKDNAIETEMKVRWIAELDGKIAADVFLMGYSELQQFSYTEAASMDAEPLVSFPHDDIYRLWLMAKIDLANGEYNKYQNTMIAYNESYGNFVRWFARVWQPAQGESGCYCMNENTPQYYITAYGLAVKFGFVGTVEQWLESLKGGTGDVTPELEQLRQDVIAEKQAAEAAAARAEVATPVIRKGTGTDSIVQVVTEPSGLDNDPQPVASERGAVALGRFTQATAKEAMAVNYNNRSKGRNSFTANSDNENRGSDSTATGHSNFIGENATSSFIGGYGNKILEGSQTVVGKYNKPDGGALFSVGDGESDDNRSNAITVYGQDSKNGRAIALGDVLMDEATLGLVKLYATNPAIREQMEKLIKIPQPVNTYLDQDFENGTAGVALIGGGGTGDVREVRVDASGNHYVHLERGSSDVKIYANVAAAVDSDYVVVSVDVASTALASTHIKLANASGSFYVVSINEKGVITSNRVSNGITQSFSADGKFVNFTIAHDAAEGRYSLWIDGVPMVVNGACPAGRLVYAEVSHTGNGGNAMIDNLKVYSYLKEWENPPLAVGVEYRTTERYNRNPVYTKLIDCGTLPNAAMKAVVHGATVGRILRVTGSSYGGSIFSVPYRYDNSVVDISATATNIEIYTNFDTSANFCLAQIWYIKD